MVVRRVAYPRVHAERSDSGGGGGGGGSCAGAAMQGLFSFPVLRDSLLERLLRCLFGPLVFLFHFIKLFLLVFFFRALDCRLLTALSIITIAMMMMMMMMMMIVQNGSRLRAAWLCDAQHHRQHDDEQSILPCAAAFTSQSFFVTPLVAVVLSFQSFRYKQETRLACFPFPPPPFSLGAARGGV